LHDQLVATGRQVERVHRKVPGLGAARGCKVGHRHLTLPASPPDKPPLIGSLEPVDLYLQVVGRPKAALDLQELKCLIGNGHVQIDPRLAGRCGGRDVDRLQKEGKLRLRMRLPRQQQQADDEVPARLCEWQTHLSDTNSCALSLYLSNDVTWLLLWQ